MQPPLDPETDLQPDDRVLFLGIPDAAIVRATAARVQSGAVIAVDPENDAVRAARRDYRDLANAMFVWASPDEIPWQTGYFSRVFDAHDGQWPNPDKVAAEVRRVLASGEPGSQGR